MNALKLNHVVKNYGDAGHPVEVLKDVSLGIAAGDAVTITGPSGCGKSTLLHLMGTLDTPTSGELEISGQDPQTFTEPQLAKFRNTVIGFVFQEHHLLPQYSVLENVLLPTFAFKNGRGDARERAQALLGRVGLERRMQHRPAELSGGERQRVAIARALINQPSIVLCDEPTGNLDGKTAESVADLFFQLHQEEQITLIVVTHNMQLAKRFPRRFDLREGQCFEA